MTQADYAGKLGVSLSYLNQMENNHRPVSARVVLALARSSASTSPSSPPAPPSAWSPTCARRFADPVFGAAPPLGDIQLVASNAPNLARAFLTLHRAHRETQERLAQLNEALGREDGALAPLPWEEVRDFFHYCDNYLDAIDRAAERFAAGLGPGDRRAALAALARGPPRHRRRRRARRAAPPLRPRRPPPDALGPRRRRRPRPSRSCTRSR